MTEVRLPRFSGLIGVMSGDRSCSTVYALQKDGSIITFLRARPSADVEPAGIRRSLALKSALCFASAVIVPIADS